MFNFDLEKLILAVVSLVVFGCPLAGRADVISECSGLSDGFVNNGGNVRTGFTFTAGQSYQLTQLDLLLGMSFDYSGAIKIDLFEIVNDELSRINNSTQEVFDLDPYPSLSSRALDDGVSLDYSGRSIFIRSGVEYGVVFEHQGPDGSRMHIGGTFGTGGAASLCDHSGRFFAEANSETITRLDESFDVLHRVHGVSVPEPGLVGVLVSLMLLILPQRRRRQRTALFLN